MTKAVFSAFLGALSLSPETKDILVHILDIDQDATIAVDTVISRLRKHIRDQRNIIRDLVAFDERKQQPDEPFHHFLVALKQIGTDAGLDDCQLWSFQSLLQRMQEQAEGEKPDPRESRQESPCCCEMQ